MNMATRFAAIVMTVVVTSVLVVLVLVSNIQDRAVTAALDSQLRQEVERIAAVAEMVGVIDSPTDAGCKSLNGSGLAASQIINGQVLCATRTGYPNLPPDATTRRVASTGRSVTRNITINGTEYRTFTRRVQIGLSDVVIRSMVPLQVATQATRDLRQQVLGLLVIVFVCVGWVSRWAARRTLRPVHALSAAVEHVVTTGTLSARVQEFRGGELATLVRQVNSMLEQLEDAERTKRSIIGDASHELRTPLTSLRANMQILDMADRLPEQERREIIHDLTLQVDDLAALVDDLIDLARDHTLTDDEKSEVDLAEIADASVQRARLMWPSTMFELASDTSVIMGNAGQISRALNNLISNAIKYGEGPVHVSVNAGVVSVRDHGPGLPEGDESRVFQRYYRSSNTADVIGSGLGLAIVEHIARAHGGEVSAATCADGGARFEMHLPLEQIDEVGNL